MLPLQLPRLSAPALAALALSAAALLPTSAQAHTLWLAKAHGQHTVMYGHGESDTDAYRPAKVEEARAQHNGQSQAVDIQAHEDRFATLHPQGEAKPGLLGFTFRSGFWHKTKAGKWHNLPRSQAEAGAQLERAIMSVTYSVNYLNAREVVQPQGYELEIVPAVNPATLTQGQTLTVQVLYQGKPLAGAKVSHNMFAHTERVATDAQGRASLPIARAGYNSWGVSHSVPFPDTTLADTLDMNATLTFTSKDNSNSH